MKYFEINVRNVISKKMALLMGICFLTGSLCACGDDTGVINSFLQKDSEQAAGKGLVSAEDLRTEWNPEATEQQEIPGGRTEETSKETFIGNHEQNSGESGFAASTDIESDESIVSITISAAGDVTLGTYPEQDYSWSLPEAYDRAQDDSYFFENVYDIFSADDMTLVNLEGVLTDAEEKREGMTYNIKGKPEYVKILTDGSVEAVGMANNHRLDYLQQGSNDTVSALKQENIVYAYEENVGIYEVKGIRIGYVSVTEVSRGAAVEKVLLNGIEKLKEEAVDLILASCHWGIEGDYYPGDYQRELGKKCIDWGADLVIGHHPHVLQGIEEYQGKYIVYSLGNFCFGANRNPADKDTMIFQQTFTFADGEKLEDGEIKIIPCSVSSTTERNDFKPTPATGEEAQRIIDKINECSKEFGVEFDSEGNLLK